MFSVTQNGERLSKSKYTWDKKEKIFRTQENDLVLDFSQYHGVTFYTGSGCSFKTSNNCTFHTGGNCIFDVGYHCIFHTGNYCTFIGQN